MSGSAGVWTLPALSLVVITAFFGVLCVLLHRLARTVRHIRDALGAIAADSVSMARACALLAPAIDRMNSGLYTVAAELSDYGDSAEELAGTD